MAGTDWVSAKLGGRTVVWDLKRGLNVMELDGVVVLPVGAEVELINPEDMGHYIATVVRVRLLAPVLHQDHPAVVCLDVDVPQEWHDDWDAHRQGKRAT